MENFECHGNCGTIIVQEMPKENPEYMELFDKTVPVTQAMYCKKCRAKQ